MTFFWKYRTLFVQRANILPIHRSLPCPTKGLLLSKPNYRETGSTLSASKRLSKKIWMTIRRIQLYRGFLLAICEKITVASISLKNYQVVPFFIIFHAGLTCLEVFYYTKCFFLQFWGSFFQKYRKIQP